jgi:peptidyl-prolyl cis-trans isomerase C
MNTAITGQECAVAQVNGVALHAPDESPAPRELRQRACQELLRQRAQALGLLDAGDLPAPDGVPSEAASRAIESLLERELRLPEPSEADCRRHYEAHPERYRSGDRVRARHILFAVTPGVDVAALRRRAETALLDVRCHDGATQGVFAAAARELSNCPSAQQGGDLGWLTPESCVPELARELFGAREVGVLPRLLHSRFGFHVIEVLERETGVPRGFEAVRGTVAGVLRQHSFVTALRQYLSLLAGQADIRGIDLDAADTPLVQ